MMRPPLGRLLIGAVLALMACSEASSADGWKLSLLAATSPAFEQVLAQAGRSGMTQAVVFKDQSFTLRQAAGPAATLISGRGRVTQGERENAVCFIAVSGQPEGLNIIRTVGSGPWEAESCIGVAAVGVLRGKDSAAPVRLGLIYRAASPNFATLEPVVLAWVGGTGGAVIDVPASNKASLAGATTFKELARALQ